MSYMLIPRKCWTVDDNCRKGAQLTLTNICNSQHTLQCQPSGNTWRYILYAYTYNSFLHAGLCVSNDNGQGPALYSNNNGKYLNVPSGASSYRGSNSSGSSVGVEAPLIENSGSKESSFTEVNHSDN